MDGARAMVVRSSPQTTHSIFERERGVKQIGSGAVHTGKCASQQARGVSRRMRISKYQCQTSALLLTGNESYDKERDVELLLRAAETLLDPIGYPAEDLQACLDTKRLSR